VEEVLVPSSSASTQVEIELNLHNDVDEVRQPEEQVLRRSHRTVRAPERYMGLYEVSVFDAEDPLTYAEVVDTWYASFSDLFMDWSKHHGVGIFDLMKKSNSLTSSDAKKNLVYIGKLVGVSSLF
jgi:hypothetical protein